MTDTLSARTCKRTAKFWLYAPVHPQQLGKDGEFGTEREPAGRSINVCANHLTRGVRGLYALPYRLSGPVSVAPAYGISGCES